MDPDSGAELKASFILKTMVISIVFSTCQYHHSLKKSLTISKKVELKSLSPTKAPVVTQVVHKKKKTIYLTFDDGPNKGTRKVMHIAEEEQLPITMFLIGEQVYGSREQMATYDSLLKCTLIELDNHSYTHAHNHYDLFYSNPDSVEKDFERSADSLHLTNRIVRTPGRNIWRTGTINSTDLKNSIAAGDSLQHKGYKAVGWDLEWHYDKDLKLQHTAAEMLQQVDSMFCKGKTKTIDHLVLLAHDQVYSDATDSAELHSFMKQLKLSDEYNFEIISNYPGITKN